MSLGNIIIEPQYLPSIAYFQAMLQAETVCLDLHAYYEKQSYRNRCHILQSNQVQTLSIPVIKGNRKQSFAQIQIDNRQNWARQHWRSLLTAYRKAAFFEFYIEKFSPIYQQDWQYLKDFNLALLTVCLEILSISPHITFSEKYLAPEDLGTLQDFRSAIHPKKPLPLIGQFGTRPYFQLFGKNFVQNLSIIDLIFNQGPEAKTILLRKR